MVEPPLVLLRLSLRACAWPPCIKVYHLNWSCQFAPQIVDIYWYPTLPNRYQKVTILFWWQGVCNLVSFNQAVNQSLNDAALGSTKCVAFILPAVHLRCWFYVVFQRFYCDYQRYWKNLHKRFLGNSQFHDGLDGCAYVKHCRTGDNT